METQPYQPTAASSLQAAKTHAREAAGELRHAAEEKVVELRGAAEAKAQHFRTSAQEQMTELENYIRSYPAKSVLVSLGVGLLLGILWRR